MKKVYRLNQQRNSATFVLQGKSGNNCFYSVQHGNVLTNVKPRLTLENEYYQDLLEKSQMFKDKVVVLERVIEDAAPVAKAPEVKKETENQGPKYKDVESVKTVAQAVDFIANTFGAQVKTAKQAQDFAHTRGYHFPNLKIKES